MKSNDGEAKQTNKIYKQELPLKFKYYLIIKWQIFLLFLAYQIFWFRLFLWWSLHYVIKYPVLKDMVNGQSIQSDLEPFSEHKLKNIIVIDFIIYIQVFYRTLNSFWFKFHKAMSLEIWFTRSFWETANRPDPGRLSANRHFEINYMNLLRKWKRCILRNCCEYIAWNWNKTRLGHRRFRLV